MQIRGKFLAIFLMCRVFPLYAANFSEAKITTEDGRIVEVSTHNPEGKIAQSSAILVIAPGQGYHREKPLVKQLAVEAAAQGYIAVRFDWSYCKLDKATKKCTGNPSDDLIPEGKDLTAVVNYAKNLPGGGSRPKSIKIYGFENTT